MVMSVRSLPDSIEQVSIVAVGLFDIDEFQPSNLRSLGSIELDELENGQVTFRVPDTFMIQYSRLGIQAEKNKVSLISTLEEPVFERVREFFLSFFGSSKKHSVTAMGINYDLHRRVADVARWHAIGHRLVPKDAWQSDLKLQNAGLLSVTVEGKRERW